MRLNQSFVSVLLLIIIIIIIAIIIVVVVIIMRLDPRQHGIRGQHGASGTRPRALQGMHSS
jgi:preprotein translocase subunit SecG